jgi:ribosome biogenesis GTPase
MKEGTILSGIGGLYEVQGEGERVRCKARGVFRKQGITPLLGDRVRYSDQCYIEEILPRRNQMIRPAVANMDQLLLVLALHSPEPSQTVLEKFLLEAGRQKLPVSLCINKMDLATGEETAWTEMREAYRQAGYPIYEISTRTGSGIESLRACLRGKITVVAGPSGVGKSSAINAVAEENDQEVGELSRKIERGKNTTRHARLLRLRDAEGLIADTPGFTSFHLNQWTTEELLLEYPEFEPYRNTCRFRDCQHIGEPGCAVREAADAHKIAPLRYASYCRLYQEIKAQERK